MVVLCGIITAETTEWYAARNAYDVTVSFCFIVTTRANFSKAQDKHIFAHTFCQYMLVFSFLRRSLVASSVDVLM